jgi:hypothetical protein
MRLSRTVLSSQRRTLLLKGRSLLLRLLDAGRDGDGAGSQPILTFLGLALPQHLNQGRAPKRNQPSLFKKALLGRRCLLTRTML